MKNSTPRRSRASTLRRSGQKQQAALPVRPPPLPPQNRALQRKKTTTVKEAKPNLENPKPPTGDQAPIQVVVQVDGSKMEPVKIAELVKLLRSPS
jgi:hypothetical protein